MRVNASSPCNDIAAFMPSWDASIVVSVFGNSLDLILMDMSCVTKEFLNAKSREDQQGAILISKFLDPRLDVIVG